MASSLISSIRQRLGLHGSFKILQAFLITAIVIAVDHFFFPKLTETSVLALMIALGAVHLSYKRTISQLARKLLMTLLGCVIAFFMTWLLPASLGQLWSFFLAVTVACVLTYLLNGGKFDTFPPIIVSLTYFAVAAPGGAPRLTLALTTIPLFAEVMFGAVSAVVVALIINSFPSERIKGTVAQDPRHTIDLRVALQHPREFLRGIDPQFYLLLLTIFVGGFIYLGLRHFFQIEYTWVIFDSLIVVSQASFAGTVSKSKTRALGTLLGAAIGIVGAFLVGATSYAFLFIPLFVAIAVFANYLVFGEYLSVTVVVTFLLMIEPTHRLSLQYMDARVLETLVAIGIALAIYGAFEAFGGKHLRRKLARITQRA